MMNWLIQYIRHLSSREKSVIVLGLVGAIAIIVYGSVAAPLVDRYINLDRVIAQKESQYRDIIQLREEYSTLKKEYTELEKS
ncbi:MAG: hypothetical protein U0940_02565, partial [Nitrospirota bacterium]|nr:hypothetical protein [Nitrospirota bacterium]